MKIYIKENRVIVEYEGGYYKIGEFEKITIEISETHGIEFTFTELNGKIDTSQNFIIELIDFVTNSTHILHSPIEDSILKYYRSIDYEEYVLEKYQSGTL